MREVIRQQINNLPSSEESLRKIEKVTSVFEEMSQFFFPETEKARELLNRKFGWLYKDWLKNYDYIMDVYGIQKKLYQRRVETHSINHIATLRVALFPKNNADSNFPKVNVDHLWIFLNKC